MGRDLAENSIGRGEEKCFGYLLGICYFPPVLLSTLYCLAKSRMQTLQNSFQEKEKFRQLRLFQLTGRRTHYKLKMYTDGIYYQYTLQLQEAELLIRF